MKLIINGEPKSSSAETLAALVEQLGMKPDRVAIELNREIVPRDRWAQTTLRDGDALEMVQFVGGGAPYTERNFNNHCHLERNKTIGEADCLAESKDPSTVKSTMPLQGVLSMPPARSLSNCIGRTPCKVHRSASEHGVLRLHETFTS
jgi:thiamine biosynthesis protein ThiS